MLVMFGGGLMIGVLLDIYRVCKEIFQIRGLVLACVDLLYWLFSAYLIFGLLWWSNWGDLRFYVLFAVCTGFFIYFRWVSKRMNRALHGIIRLIVMVIGGITHLIWVLMCKPLLKILRILRLITVWIIVRLPQNTINRWLKPIWHKNREKK